MLWPASSYDYYVDPVSGSDSHNGSNDTTQAWRTLAHAASSVGSYARVWMAEGTHTIASPIVYTDKRIQWIGPTFDPDTEEPKVLWTGSALSSMMTTQAGSGHNVFGGGVHNVMFDATALVNGASALILKQCCYFRLENWKFKGPTSGSWKRAYVINPNSGGTAPHSDMSWLRIRNGKVWNAGFLSSPPCSAGFNGWDIADVEVDGDSPATDNVMFVDNKLQGCGIYRPTIKHIAAGGGGIYIDETGITQSRSVNIINPTISNVAAGAYGIELLTTQSYVLDDGDLDASAKVWGNSGVTGFMDVDAAHLAGSLNNGQN